MRIPVCGLDEAVTNWANSDFAKDSDRYVGFPCNNPLNTFLGNPIIGGNPLLP